jgi:hypothetical protein
MNDGKNKAHMKDVFENASDMNFTYAVSDGGPIINQDV